MFVDTFLKNRSSHFDENHSECKTFHQNSCNGNITGVRDSLSCNLKICLEKQPNF